jgi:L-fuconolactonase
MRVIRKDFLPATLRPTIAQAGVDGVISVQARQCIEETQWLLDLAAANTFIRGVVGWLPLASANVQADLDRFSTHPKLRAVRHVVQGEPDPAFLQREDFNRGVSLLSRYHLAYDILIVERQLPATISFVDRHPNQVFILDHIAKPRIKESILEPWAANLKELARRPNVYCKLSGMATEADYHTWTESQLRPYMEATLAAFGPRRLIFGSDWPVCLVACDYHRWVRVVEAFVSTLSPHEQQAFWCDNARAAYAI